MNGCSKSRPEIRPKPQVIFLEQMGLSNIVSKLTVLIAPPRQQHGAHVLCNNRGKPHVGSYEKRQHQEGSTWGQEVDLAACSSVVPIEKGRGDRTGMQQRGANWERTGDRTKQQRNTNRLSQHGSPHSHIAAVNLLASKCVQRALGSRLVGEVDEAIAASTQCFTIHMPAHRCIWSQPKNGAMNNTGPCTEAHGK